MNETRRVHIPAQRTGAESVRRPDIWDVYGNVELIGEQFSRAFAVLGLALEFREAPDELSRTEIRGAEHAVFAALSTLPPERPSYEVLSGILIHADWGDYTGLEGVAKVRRSVKVWRQEAAQVGGKLSDREAFTMLRILADQDSQKPLQEQQPAIQYHAFLAYHLMGGDIKSGKLPF